MKQFSWIVLTLVAVVSAPSFADGDVAQVGALLDQVNIDAVTSVRLVDGGQIRPVQGQGGVTTEQVDRSAVIEIQGTYSGTPGQLVGELEPTDQPLHGANMIALNLKLRHVAPQLGTLFFGGGGKPPPPIPNLPFRVRVGLDAGMFFGGGIRDYGHAPQTSRSWMVTLLSTKYTFSVEQGSQQLKNYYGFTAVMDTVGNPRWNEAKGWTITPVGFKQ